MDASVAHGPFIRGLVFSGALLHGASGEQSDNIVICGGDIASGYVRYTAHASSAFALPLPAGCEALRNQLQLLLWGGLRVAELRSPDQVGTVMCRHSNTGPSSRGFASPSGARTGWKQVGGLKQAPSLRINHTDCSTSWMRLSRLKLPCTQTSEPGAVPSGVDILQLSDSNTWEPVLKAWAEGHGLQLPGEVVVLASGAGDAEVLPGFTANAGQVRAQVMSEAEGLLVSRFERLVDLARLYERAVGPVGQVYSRGLVPSCVPLACTVQSSGRAMAAPPPGPGTRQPTSRCNAGLCRRQRHQRPETSSGGGGGRCGSSGGRGLGCVCGVQWHCTWKRAGGGGLCHEGLTRG